MLNEWHTEKVFWWSFSEHKLSFCVAYLFSRKKVWQLLPKLVTTLGGTCKKDIIVQLYLGYADYIWCCYPVNCLMVWSFMTVLMAELEGVEQNRHASRLLSGTPATTSPKRGSRSYGPPESMALLLWHQCTHTAGVAGSFEVRAGSINHISFWIYACFVPFAFEQNGIKMRVRGLIFSFQYTLNYLFLSQRYVSWGKQNLFVISSENEGIW